MVTRVLVVEDDANIADLIRVNLEETGAKIFVESNGQMGLNQALTGEFDLILLDILLPEVNGLDICRQVRSQLPEQAILMLTAKTSEMDRVLGLELGADDYMTKPFSVRELQARVRAQLRKVQLLDRAKQLNQAQEINQTTDTSELNDCYQVGLLSISEKLHQASINQSPLDLTATEFDLLLFFAKHPNQVFSRNQLLESVWGYQHNGYEHTVNSHINRLRSKMSSNGNCEKVIETVWGVGYRFNPKAVMARPLVAV